MADKLRSASKQALAVVAALLEAEYCGTPEEEHAQFTMALGIALDDAARAGAEWMRERAKAALEVSLDAEDAHTIDCNLGGPCSCGAIRSIVETNIDAIDVGEMS